MYGTVAPGRAGQEALAALLLWLFCGLTFASVQIGAAVRLGRR